MARRKVHRDVPPLARLFAGHAGFPAGANRSALLLESLRGAALRVRRSQPRAFYAMRDVAAFFAVPLPTVSRAYRALEDEGLLSRLRSSMTMVRPRRARPRARLRAVVGLPVWQQGFLELRDWRAFFIELEEQLRRSQFVGDLLFYEHDRRFHRAFPDRLWAHRLDVLLWFMPLPEHYPIIEAMTDRGVTAIVVSGPDETEPCPWTRYRVSWRRALASAAREWSSEGVHGVRLMRPTREPTRSQAALCADVGVAAQSWRSEPLGDGIEDYLRRLVALPRTALVLDDDLMCAGLCRLAPSLMADLLRRHRVLVTREIDLPRYHAGDARCDGALIDWQRLVRRIVADLKTETLPAAGAPVTIEARWLPRRRVWPRDEE
ncbi:MAG TPA: hypothetical protein VEL07_17620 [Planctomycetota bacterium]|nr:hypothetical protein [Planctomycetota bacterium]